MRGGAANFFCVMAIASFAYALACSFMACAQPTEPAPAPTSTPKPSAEEIERRKAWHENMSKTPTPKPGCYKSTYPNTQWEEVPCTTAPNRPYPLAHGPRPDNVGGGSGFAAVVAGSISTAVGFFASATDALRETGGGNTFSLQLNTNRFNTASCTRLRPRPRPRVVKAGSNLYSPIRAAGLYNIGWCTTPTAAPAAQVVGILSRPAPLIPARPGAGVTAPTPWPSPSSR
jgi:hypothetical protein